MVVGAGVMDALKKVHQFVKDKKLISKGVDALGYGKKKPKRAGAGMAAKKRKGGFLGLIKKVIRPTANLAMDVAGLGRARHRKGGLSLGNNVYDPLPKAAILV